MRCLADEKGAHALKLYRYSGKVTYLVCPGLDREAALELRIQVTLPALSIDVFDYARREERPRLGWNRGR